MTHKGNNKIHTELYNLPNKGVRLRVISFLFILLALSVALLFVSETISSVGRYYSSRDTQLSGIKCQRLTASLMAEIDKQTALIREYVIAPVKKREAFDNYMQSVELSEEYIDSIFYEINSKNVVMSYYGFYTAVDTYETKKSCEFYSVRLLIKAYKSLKISDFPSEISGIELTNTVSSYSADRLKTLAVSRLSSDEYLSCTFTVREQMSSFLMSVSSDTEVNYELNESRLMTLINNQSYIIAAIVFILILFVLMNRTLIISPLIKAVSNICANKRLDVKGAYEMMILAISYNDLYDTNASVHKDLSYRANHDALTGVNNRDVFDRLCSLAAEKRDKDVTLLILDIDSFKSINDTNGHDVGDAALKKVADSLSHVFDSIGQVCRIGGDEFAIFLPGMNHKDLNVINRNLHKLFGIINDTEDTIPDLTLSVGIAFGSREGEDYDLYKHADTAMYKSKENTEQSTVTVYGVSD